MWPLFIRIYSTFLLFSYLTSFTTSQVHVPAAPDYVLMYQVTTGSPLKFSTSDFKEQQYNDDRDHIGTKGDFKEQQYNYDKDNTGTKEDVKEQRYSDDSDHTSTKDDRGKEATTDGFTTNAFCGSPPNILYGMLEEQFSTQNTFRIGSVVTYKCITNYANIPGAANTAICMSNGRWSLLDTFCKPNFCSSLPRLDYAQPKVSLLDKTIFTKGFKAFYDCRPGYTRVPGKINYVICTGDGTWSLPENFCTRRTCGNPGEANNAEMIAEDFLFGSKVTYICNPGYKMVSRRNYRECLANGAWSNALPECEVQLCLQPQTIKNGDFYPWKEEYAYLDSVTYTCNRPLALIGESSISCNEDGQWSSNAPECREVQCRTPNVENSRKISGTSGPYYFNSVVRFKCNSNHVLNGSDTIKCNINSQWEPKPPICLGICKSVPDISFAELVEPTTDRSFVEGTTLRFKCKAGFEPVPGESDTLRCSKTNAWDSSARWTSPSEFCTPKFCGNPEPINNGYISSGTPYFGYELIYECNRGYKIKANSTNKRRCQADGSLSLPIPECEVQTCPSPIKTLGTSFTPEKPQYQYNDRLNFSCDEGYELNGSFQSNCNHEGKWVPDLPTCIGICHTPTELKNAKLSFSHINKTIFYKGETVNFVCINGYTNYHEYKINRTCLGTFKWSHSTNFCTRISCGPPENIPNAVYKADDYLFGSEAVYKCTHGYKMVAGINSRKCLHTKKWSEPVPQCKVQTCSPPKDIEYGSYSIEKPIYTFEDKVTYSCDNLTLVGEASVYCTAEGTWSSKAPECKAVCKVPAEPKYGVLENSLDKNMYFKIGTTLKFKCRPGYIPVEKKSNEITCLDNLTWSEPEVFCERLSCDKPADIAHGQMHYKDFLFESSVNYTCKEEQGYTMFSRKNYRDCQADGTWSGKPPVCKESICDNIWELQEEARKCTSTPDEWIKYLQVQYLYLQIENLKLDIEIKKKKLSEK
ncbi:complement receptor type 1-like isoform X3 [Pyxicephalus adspersus]|uniref:complement receptor type 1-like isoform X3 n=1 Tax=Pyxicephalus adspersus TaxID=30357 RepID=UPI003B59A7CC